MFCLRARLATFCMNSVRSEHGSTRDGAKAGRHWLNEVIAWSGTHGPQHRMAWALQLVAPKYPDQANNRSNTPALRYVASAETLLLVLMDAEPRARKTSYGLS